MCVRERGAGWWKKKRKSYKHAECSSNPSWTPEVVVSRTMFVKRSFKPRRSKKDRSDEGRADDPDLVLFVRRWDLDLIIIKEKEKRFAGYTRAKTTALSRNGVHRIINTRLPSAVAIPLLSFVVLLVRRNPMCVYVYSFPRRDRKMSFVFWWNAIVGVLRSREKVDRGFLQRMEQRPSARSTIESADLSLRRRCEVLVFPC